MKRKNLLDQKKTFNGKVHLFIYLFILLFELKETNKIINAPNTHKFTENGKPVYTCLILERFQF